MTGASTLSTFARLQRDLPRIQESLREMNLDGWLLYDLHARNSVTARLTDLGDLTRRYFVLIPKEGEPFAVVHGIEEAPWANWPWPRQVYVGWRQLEEVLKDRLAGKLAMEISEGDAVPAMDLVPSGVVELVKSSGAQVVSSGNLVTQFYSVWSDEDLASHRRSSQVLRDVALATFARIGRAVAAGETVTEAGAKEWVQADLVARGVRAGGDCIVAGTLGAADPHYSPVGNGATLRAGDVVLLDLWGKETEESVYSDQTWMAYLGAQVPDRARDIFAVIRDARDAGVRFLKDSWKDGKTIPGGAVDDVVRGVVNQRGFGQYFIHRTGHSIDQATHGMGPNIDNLETREVRTLIPGVGFSIEPGIYIKGDIGVRTEINVFIGRDGPEVTTPQPQTEILSVAT